MGVIAVECRVAAIAIGAVGVLNPLVAVLDVLQANQVWPDVV